MSLAGGRPRIRRSVGEINVNIDPEQVNKAVAEAIIQSIIGEQPERVIKEQVQRVSRSYDNPIEGVVKAEIRDAITNIVQRDYSEQIRAMVAEKMAGQFTEDLFRRMWDSFVNRY